MDVTLKTDIPGFVLNIHTENGKGVMSWRRDGVVLIRTFLHPDAVDILEEQFRADLITQ
jgi:hypothetical protein